MRMKPIFAFLLLCGCSLAHADDKTCVNVKSILDGKELVATGLEKEVVVQVDKSRYLSLKIPVVAYVDRRETKLLPNDIERLRSSIKLLEAFRSLPPSEKVKDSNLVEYNKALQVLQGLSAEFEARIDPTVISNK